MQTPTLYRSPNTAPPTLSGPSVFLAGSIEMGKAELWQPRVAGQFLAAGVHVFDPRRDDWNAGWAHDPTPGTPFEGQVSWELAHLEAADVAYFRITGDGPAIVSMLELGLMIGSKKPVIVHADACYIRHGNIAITTRRFGVPLFENEEDAIAAALQALA